MACFITLDFICKFVNDRAGVRVCVNQDSRRKIGLGIIDNLVFDM